MHEGFHAIDRQSGLSQFPRLAPFVAAGSSVKFGISFHDERSRGAES
jgi:hypothetical protein